MIEKDKVSFGQSLRYGGDIVLANPPYSPRPLPENEDKKLKKVEGREEYNFVLFQKFLSGAGGHCHGLCTAVWFAAGYS